MATYDLSYLTGGNTPGLQMQGGAMLGVNVFEFDWAELKSKAATWAAGDIITIGSLPAGALALPCAAETLVASQAGASAIVFQDDTATPVVFISSHDPTTAGTKTPASQGTALFFGGGSTTGLHPAYVTPSKKVNVVLGTTPPTSGKCRISFPLALVAAIGL
jgi:hypothetical protein